MAVPVFNLFLVRCAAVARCCARAELVEAPTPHVSGSQFAYADTKSFQIPLRQTHLPAKTTLTLCDTNSLLDPLVYGCRRRNQPQMGSHDELFIGGIDANSP
jgi:hypothetical protein